MNRKHLDRISANKQGDMKLVEKLLRDGCGHKIGEELGWDKRKVQRIIQELNKVYGDSNRIHSIRRSQNTNKDASNITYKMEYPQQLAFSETLFDSNDRDYIFSLYQLLAAIGETIPTKDILGSKNIDDEDIFKGKIDAGSCSVKTKKNIVLLYKPLMDNKVVKFSYPLKMDKNNVATVSPYCIKTFNGKWYLFGYKHIIGGNINKWDIYDLNLISDIKECNDFKFRPIELKEINRYYESQVGFFPVTPNSKGNNYPTQEDIDANIWEVRFRIADPETNDEEERKQLKYKWYWYIKNNPIHGSQIETVEDHSRSEYEFCLKVGDSPNLFNRLRRRGSEIEILEPQALRDRMKEESRKLYNLYNKEDNK